jgi:tetratricopeptide (TPR) repeat protein
LGYYSPRYFASYYDPFYPSYFYPPYYPGYGYGTTVIHETVVQEQPVVIDGATVVHPVAEPGAVADAGPAVGAVQPGPDVPPPPAPGSMEDLLMRGDGAFARGQYVTAGELYGQAALADAESPHPHFATVLAGFALGDYKLAATSLRRAMKMFPELALSEADLSEAYRVPGDFQRHLNALLAHVETLPDDADGWLVLGYVQYFTGSKPAGLMSLSKALELNPGDDVLQRFFEAAQAAPVDPAETRPIPIDEAAAQPAEPDDKTPPATEPPATEPAEKTGAAAPPATPAPESAQAGTPSESSVTGSDPGVSVEFAPPATTDQAEG